MGFRFRLKAAVLCVALGVSCVAMAAPVSSSAEKNRRARLRKRPSQATWLPIECAGKVGRAGRGTARSRRRV